MCITYTSTHTRTLDIIATYCTFYCWFINVLSANERSTRGQTMVEKGKKEEN